MGLLCSLCVYCVQSVALYYRNFKKLSALILSGLLVCWAVIRCLSFSVTCVVHLFAFVATFSHALHFDVLVVCRWSQCWCAVFSSKSHGTVSFLAFGLFLVLRVPITALSRWVDVFLHVCLWQCGGLTSTERFIRCVSHNRARRSVVRLLLHLFMCSSCEHSRSLFCLPLTPRRPFVLRIALICFKICCPECCGLSVDSVIIISQFFCVPLHLAVHFVSSAPARFGTCSWLLCRNRFRVSVVRLHFFAIIFCCPFVLFACN